MRYAVISDIHGNLEALKKVLRSIKKNKVDEILCLGDIVGYGPNPNECVERIRKMDIKAVAGNHEYALADESLLECFNPIAKEAALWTKGTLKPENLKYLACLPFTAKLPDILLVHGSPIGPRSFDYILNVIEAMSQFHGFEERICFIGHSHAPMIFSSDGDVFRKSVSLQEGNRYIINVGSVGQPRDGNSLACYGILDTCNLTFSFIRVDYNSRKTAKKIINAGLPVFLAERLLEGR
ncbi:MAG: metallophosphoesterase family protein [Candidatus Nealsonbacteria bacterium]|nr:metallophosphoesterase family protein [Candidatus Nealsonbacteria bacterium]